MTRRVAAHVRGERPGGPTTCDPGRQRLTEARVPKPRRPFVKITPVQRKSVSDSVYEQLRDQIVEGVVPPGQNLPAERVLCEMLSVNRGAVREALKRLEQARLVSIQHGGGTTVLDYRDSAGLDLLVELLLRPDGSLDTTVMRSILEMRASIGRDIARLAAARGGQPCADALTLIIDRMAAAEGDLATLQVLSLEFWGELVRGSGNVAYRLAFNTLRETYGRFRHLFTQILQTELTDYARYAALRDAVVRQDPDSALATAEALIEQGAASLRGVLAALEASQEG